MLKKGRRSTNVEDRGESTLLGDVLRQVVRIYTPRSDWFFPPEYPDTKLSRSAESFIRDEEKRKLGNRINTRRSIDLLPPYSDALHDLLTEHELNRVSRGRRQMGSDLPNIWERLERHNERYRTGDRRKVIIYPPKERRDDS